MRPLKEKIEEAVKNNGAPLRECNEQVICGALASFFENFAVSGAQLPEINNMYLFQWVQSNNKVGNSYKYAESYALVLDLDKGDDLKTFYFDPLEEPNGLLNKGDFARAYFQEDANVMSAIVTNKIQWQDVADKDFNALYGYFKKLREDRREITTDGFTNESGLILEGKAITATTPVNYSTLNIVIKKDNYFYPLCAEHFSKPFFSDDSWEHINLAQSLYLNDTYPLILELSEEEYISGFNKKNPQVIVNIPPMKIYNEPLLENSISKKGSPGITQIFNNEDFFWQNVGSISDTLLRANAHLFVFKALTEDPKVKTVEKQIFLEGLWEKAEKLNINKSGLAKLISGCLTSENKELVEGFSLNISEHVKDNAFSAKFEANVWVVKVNLIDSLFNANFFGDEDEKKFMDVSFMLSNDKLDNSNRKIFNTQLDNLKKGLDKTFNVFSQTLDVSNIFLLEKVSGRKNSSREDLSITLMLKDLKDTNSAFKEYINKDEPFLKVQDFKDIVGCFFKVNKKISTNKAIEASLVNLSSISSNVSNLSVDGCIQQELDVVVKRLHSRLLNEVMEAQLNNKEPIDDNPHSGFKL